MLYRPYGLYKYPWERKQPRAFFRGTGYCSGYHHGLAACSRSYFAHRSHYCAACNDLIDAGGFGGGGGTRPCRAARPLLRVRWQQGSVRLAHAKSWRGAPE
jgi:hypothetical protein